MDFYVNDDVSKVVKRDPENKKKMERGEREREKREGERKKNHYFFFPESFSLLCCCCCSCCCFPDPAPLLFLSEPWQRQSS